MASAGGGSIHEMTARYCFIDLDLNQHRSKLATAAAFVDATDSRYGFSSKDLLSLGGSELARVQDSIHTDHEWSSKVAAGIEIRPPEPGNRIVLKLFWDVAPLACENFATLCDNGTTSGLGKKRRPPPVGESGKPLTYRNSTVHRVVSNFILQGGDFIFGNGSGGESIFNGKKFKDERPGLLRKHDRRGILSMGNSGKNSNSSQWFITFAAAPQCDGKHVVFGEIISGWEVIDAVETLGSASGEPIASVAVTDCGLWTPLTTPAAGYWFDQPDADSFTGVSSVFVVRPRVAVLAPSDAVLETMSKALLPYPSVKLIVAAGSVAKAKLVNELLANFEVDVVLVAPACKSVIAAIQLPESWNRKTTAGFVLEAKPVEAFARVRTMSWLSQETGWKLDGP
jgi:peptidylprolyl isomerase